MLNEAHTRQLLMRNYFSKKYCPDITWSADDLKQFTDRQPARDSGNQIVDESV